MKKQKIIEKYLDKILPIKECINYLSCSERTFYRWLKNYKEHGPPGLIHGLKGRPSNHQGDGTKYGYIKDIVKKDAYKNFGPTLMKEHLEEDFGTIINKETLRQIMTTVGVWTPNPRRNKITRIMRERKSTFGMMTQFDGSYDDWFENGEEQCLLHAIDDATGKSFCRVTKGESLLEVLRFWFEYLKRFGKPEIIYVDRHATYKVNHPADQWDTTMLTCFQRGMGRLGILVIYSKCPEGKGRVERGNRTHQDRLIKKMRLKGINDMEEANRYLDDYYLDYHNSKFSKLAREIGDVHKPLTSQEHRELERIFSRESSRTVKRDGTIRYTNTIYQLPKGITLKSRIITVQESIYGHVRILDGTDCLHFTKIPKR